MASSSNRIEVSLSAADRALLKRIANALEGGTVEVVEPETPKRLVEAEGTGLRMYWGDEPQARPTKAPHDLWSAEHPTPETD